MIYQLTQLDLKTLEKLSSNNYTRRIKSHFLAYSTKYEFCRFFAVDDYDKHCGIICMFNSSMIVSGFDGTAFSRDILSEIASFAVINKPLSVEFPVEYSQDLERMCSIEYIGDKRTEFAFSAQGELPELNVQELPRLDDVYAILAQCFPAIKNNHGLWLTDTSHRVRRGLAQSFILDSCSTATVQYIIDRVALIGHVGTLPEERGKHHARKLLYWIGEKLTADGFDVRLFARPHRVSYYEEIGFKKCGLDIVLERKDTDF
ncbi:N-acetyltransferase [Ruminococcus sp. FC2018]|uniref:N-acetyltransferase n=1 Tax=Ruminococcus sp. FC2018 TaxID=1410617 RepID=UPI00048F2B9D|nr:N-acetyltransferase [Ruminococcus sp. FC2018]